MIGNLENLPHLRFLAHLAPGNYTHLVNGLFKHLLCLPMLTNLGPDLMPILPAPQRRRCALAWFSDYLYPWISVVVFLFPWIMIVDYFYPTGSTPQLGFLSWFRTQKSVAAFGDLSSSLAVRLTCICRLFVWNHLKKTSFKLPWVGAAFGHPPDFALPLLQTTLLNGWLLGDFLILVCQTDGQLCLNFRRLLHPSWSSSPLVSACNCQLYAFVQPVRPIKPPGNPRPRWFIPTSPETQSHPVNFRPFYNKNLTYLRWFISINTPAFFPPFSFSLIYNTPIFFLH